MTGDDRGDRSIHIGGNAHVSGQVAGGEQIIQTQHIAGADPGPAEVLDRLDRLERLLDQHAAELAEPDKARRDLADVRAEVAEPEPDPDRISDSVKRLTRRVASVGALAEAARLLAEKLLGQ
jgi:hypothetical protein